MVIMENGRTHCALDFIFYFRLLLTGRAEGFSLDFFCLSLNPTEQDFDPQVASLVQRKRDLDKKRNLVLIIIIVPVAVAPLEDLGDISLAYSFVIT